MMEGFPVPLSDYRYRTELHCHSNPASPCSNFTPDEVIAHYAPLGYDSIVLCNHFHAGIPGYEDKERFIEQYLNDFAQTVEAAKPYGISVIFGCEIRFAKSGQRDNDYLLFGIEPKDIPVYYDYLDGSLADFSAFFRNEEHLLIQAHPNRSNILPVDPSLLDGFEVFNLHPGHNSGIALAAKTAAENDFIVTCGTDFHHEGHQGLGALLTKEKITDPHQLCRVLKSRDYLFSIGRSVVLPYGVTEAFN